MRLDHLIRQLPSEWIARFVRTFEDGRVQKHPHARFVNARGECCLVGALAGARSSAEYANSDVARSCRPDVEALSRGFEARRFTGQDFYEWALLVLAARKAHRTTVSAPRSPAEDSCSAAAAFESASVHATEGVAAIL